MKKIIILSLVLVTLLSGIALAGETLDDTTFHLANNEGVIEGYSGLSAEILDISEIHSNLGVGAYIGGRKWIKEDIAIGGEVEYILANSDNGYAEGFIPKEGANILGLSALGFYETYNDQEIKINLLGGLSFYHASFKDSEISDTSLGIRIGAEGSYEVIEDLYLNGKFVRKETQGLEDVNNANISSSQFSFGLLKQF